MLEIGASFADAIQRKGRMDTEHDRGMFNIYFSIPDTVRQSPMLPGECRVLGFGFVGAFLYVLCGGREVDKIKRSCRVILLSQPQQIAPSRRKASGQHLFKLFA